MKKKVLSLALAATMTAALFAGCSTGTNSGNTDTTDTNETKAVTDETQGTTAADLSALAGTYDITVWVSESDGVAELTEQQIARFCEENPDIQINATVEGISESNSASQMITDVASGADLYCFAQDQLTRLVEADALVKLGEGASATVTERNDATSVKAASVAGSLYCYPLTSDNGYFMFYDKSVITDTEDLASIIAECEAAGRNFSMECETSAWYTASFFFATGCTSDWTTDLDGNFTSVNDTFNSDAGVVAMKGMQIVVKSPNYVSSSDTADFAAAVPSAVVVSGTWGAKAAKEALGDNYAVADLPSFTVDGTTYHMGSYSGCKLMGVKPSDDATKTAVLQQLALYLTNAECQLERFNLVGWGPSNLEAQADEAVASNPALCALAEQAEYAIPQGNIHGSWWDLAKVLGTYAKEATTDEEIVAGLEAYEQSLQDVLSMSDEEKNAWSIIGSFDDTGWGVDVPMEGDGNGTYTVTYNFKAGDEFKCRMGASWDVNFGITNGETVLGGDNVVIEADGTYLVTLVYDADAGTGVLTVEAQ